MKKTTSVLLAGLALTGLTACGGQETEKPTTESNSTNSTEKVEVKLWLDNDDYGAAMEEAIEAKLPHIDINFEKVGSVDAVSKLE